MASAAEAVGPGALVAVADDDVVEVAELVVFGAPAVRDGVMGVSSVGPGLPAGTWEHPATSIDAANNTAIRIRSG